MHDHETEMRRPLLVIHVLSLSPTFSPAATRPISAFTRPASSGAMYVSQKTVPPVSSGADLERALEGLVGRRRREHAVLVDQAEQARRLVRDRVEEHALALPRLRLRRAAR